MNSTFSGESIKFIRLAAYGGHHSRLDMWGTASCSWQAAGQSHTYLNLQTDHYKCVSAGALAPWFLCENKPPQIYEISQKNPLKPYLH